MWYYCFAHILGKPVRYLTSNKEEPRSLFYLGSALLKISQGQGVSTEIERSAALCLWPVVVKMGRG